MGHLITFKEFFDDQEGAKLNEGNSLLGTGWWRGFKTFPFSYFTLLLSVFKEILIFMQSYCVPNM